MTTIMFSGVGFTAVVHIYTASSGTETIVTGCSQLSIEAWGPGGPGGAGVGVGCNMRQGGGGGGGGFSYCTFSGMGGHVGQTMGYVCGVPGTSSTVVSAGTFSMSTITCNTGSTGGGAVGSSNGTGSAGNGATNTNPGAINSTGSAGTNGNSSGTGGAGGSASPGGFIPGDGSGSYGHGGHGGFGGSNSGQSSGSSGTVVFGYS